MKRSRYLVFGAAMVAVLTGCQSIPDKPIVSRSVESYAITGTDRKLYLLIPFPETGLKIGDPLFNAYAEPIHASLQAAGYTRATSQDADILIGFSFESDIAQASIESSKPIYTTTGGDTQFHTFSVPTPLGPKTITGTSTSVPRLKLSGYQPYVTTKSFRRGLLTLEAYPWPISEPLQRLWITGASIVGEDLPMGVQLSALLAKQLPPHIGTNSGRITNCLPDGKPSPTNPL